MEKEIGNNKSQAQLFIRSILKTQDDTGNELVNDVKQEDVLQNEQKTTIIIKKRVKKPRVVKDEPNV